MTLTRCYCINLRNAAAAVSDIYDSYLKPFGLTVRQYSLLTCLGQIGEASTTYLADYVSLDRTFVYAKALHFFGFIYSFSLIEMDVHV